MTKRLYRSQKERIIGGVAGGIGEYFDIDPVWVRLAFVLLVFAGASGLVAYLVLWIIVPRQTSEARGKDVVVENVADIKEDLKGVKGNLKEAFSKKDQPQAATVAGASTASERSRSPYIVGVILIIVGAVLLLSNLPILRWFNWGRYWPIVLVLAGVVLLLARVRRKE